jgi:ABC-type branched-subunit amino acid transport system substrate-binding protein
VVYQPDEKEDIDTVVVVTPPVDTVEKKEDNNTASKWAKKKKYAISFILPFHLDELELESAILQDNITGMQNLASIEFYEGALLAMDTLKAMGFVADIYLYDDMRDQGTLQGILSIPDLGNSDVVIGPVFNNTLGDAAEWARQEEKFLISPFSPSSSITSNNPWFIMANSTLATQMEAMQAYWLSSGDKPQIIIAGRKSNPGDSILISAFQEAYAHLEYKGYKPSPVVISDAGAISSAMIQGKKNYVYVASLDELFVNGMLRNLSIQIKNYDIEVGGLSPILDMESLSADYFENLHFQYSSSYWVNPLSPKLENFQAAFKSRFNAIPSEYAMRGYDLTLYTGYMLLHSGPNLPDGFTRPRPSRKMLYEFKFDAYNNAQNQMEFFENKNIFILRYDQYRFEQVN